MPSYLAIFEFLGTTEMLVIAVVALIIFGPRKLPELGRSLGKSIGEFRKASNELKSTLEEEIRLEETREQRAKVEAEQHSALQAATPVIATPSPVATPQPPADDAPTVSRTTTGTPA